MLLWLCNGVLKLRAVEIDAMAKNVLSDHEADSTYHPYPHHPFGFTDIPLADHNHPIRGLRCRTIMVSNLPRTLRNEKDLKEYFEHYMTQKTEKPSVGLTLSTQPGFFNKSLAFLLNRAKRLPAQFHPSFCGSEPKPIVDVQDNSVKEPSKFVIERVVIARKMIELASDLERREEILRNLETAHIKLATKTLTAVKAAMDREYAKKPLTQKTSKAMKSARNDWRSFSIDVESGVQEELLDEEARMEKLIKVLGPFVGEFELQDPFTTRSKNAIASTSQHALNKLLPRNSVNPSEMTSCPDHSLPPRLRYSNSRPGDTIWDALLSLPRSSLDIYQPLIHLERVLQNQIVPSIDYWTTRLNYVTTLIKEHRDKSLTSFEPVSTAFVTFSDPADARRACRYLAAHPNNPLSCLVTMAPMYSDLDWMRVMKSSFRAEVRRVIELLARLKMLTLLSS